MLIDTGDNEMKIRFISIENLHPIDWPNFDWSNETEVVVLRASLFFHSEQIITLGKLREFFSDTAIKLLEKDGYVKLKTNKK